MFGSDNKIQCRVQSEGTAGSGKKSDTALAGIETYKKKSDTALTGLEMSDVSFVRLSSRFDLFIASKLASDF